MNNKNIYQPDYAPYDEIKEICKKIVALQKEAVREELNESCDRNFLGNQEIGKEKLNTRPIMIYTHEDRTWHCPIDRNENDCKDRNHELTCVFRVEKVEDGTVTLRALKEMHREYDGEECNNWWDSERYKSTNSYITIKFADIAALRCLEDTFVDICIR